MMAPPPLNPLELLPDELDELEVLLVPVVPDVPLVLPDVVLLVEPVMGCAPEMVLPMVPPSTLVPEFPVFAMGSPKKSVGLSLASPMWMSRHVPS